MRIFLHFNQVGQAYLLHELAKYWRSAFGCKNFAGVTISKEHDHRQFLLTQTDIDYHFIDEIDELESRALVAPFDDTRLDLWESRLQIPLWDLVAADRNIGHWFLRGVQIIETDLTKLSDHDIAKRITLTFLDHFFDRLSEFKPDFVFSPANASTHSLALFHVCQFMEIPWYTLTSARVGNRHLISENNPNARSLFFEQNVTKESKRISKDSLTKGLQDYFDSFVTADSARPDWDKDVWNIIQLTHGTSFLNFSWSILKEFLAIFKRSLTQPPKTKRHLRTKHNWSIFFAYFRKQVGLRFFSENNFFPFESVNEPFVFYALHFEPERTMMIDGPNYMDQVRTINLLAKNVPLSHKLYVKEHRSMIGARPRSFYKAIRENPNVRMISPYADSHQLIKLSSVTVTITGTVGWEALMIGKPVLVLGQCLFSNLPGVTRCTDTDFLAETIKTLIYDPPTRDHQQQNALKALNWIDQLSFDFPWDFLWQSKNAPKYSDLNQQEVMSTLGQQIMLMHKKVTDEKSGTGN